MGWSFAYSLGYDKAACIRDLRSPTRFGPQTKLLQACTVGNHHWYLAETEGVKWIGLDLLAGGGKESGWGHKSMDERSGPNYYDCPITYLDKASEPLGYAIEWRKAVRQYHANKRKSGKPQAGQVVKYGGYEYKLLRPAGPRKGWHVHEVTTGQQYRMNSKQLAKALEIVIPLPY
jgi:hypothetical protein